MFLKNRNIISKMKRSKVTDYAALTNSIDTNEMLYYTAYHLGIHCLQQYSLKDFQ